MNLRLSIISPRILWITGLNFPIENICAPQFSQNFLVIGLTLSAKCLYPFGIPLIFTFYSGINKLTRSGRTPAPGCFSAIIAMTVYLPQWFRIYCVTDFTSLAFPSEFTHFVILMLNLLVFLFLSHIKKDNF